MIINETLNDTNIDQVSLDTITFVIYHFCHLFAGGSPKCHCETKRNNCSLDNVFSSHFVNLEVYIKLDLKSVNNFLSSIHIINKLEFKLILLFTYLIIIKCVSSLNLFQRIK